MTSHRVTTTSHRVMMTSHRVTMTSHPHLLHQEALLLAPPAGRALTLGLLLQELLLQVPQRLPAPPHRLPPPCSSPLQALQGVGQGLLLLPHLGQPGGGEGETSYPHQG